MYIRIYNQTISKLLELPDLIAYLGVADAVITQVLRFLVIWVINFELRPGIPMLKGRGLDRFGHGFVFDMGWNEQTPWLTRYDTPPSTSRATFLPLFSVEADQRRPRLLGSSSKRPHIFDR